MPEDDEKYFSGAQASEFLGVKSATLYAYASRGMIESIPAESGRERAYRLSDLIKLRQSSRGFKSQKDQETPTWTGPVIKSSITEIRHDGHYYRGNSAIDLARQGQPVELVAELLWQRNAGLKEWQVPKPLPLSKQLKHLASAEVDYLDLLKLLIASAEISDPVTRKLSADDIFATARRLIVTMAIAPGFDQNKEAYICQAQYPIAQTLLTSLRATRSRETAGTPARTGAGRPL